MPFGHLDEEEKGPRASTKIQKNFPRNSVLLADEIKEEERQTEDYFILQK